MVQTAHYAAPSLDTQYDGLENAVFTTQFQACPSWPHDNNSDIAKEQNNRL